MKLTKIERLILSNQYRILASLYPDEAKAFETNRKVVEEGYTYQYSWLADHLSSEVPEEDSRYVLDVLDMFSDLLFSFDQLTDKSGIDAYDVKFRGFDGNNETSLMSYARFFVQDLDRYNEFQNHDFNSHMPTTALYSRMLEVYRPIKAACREGMRRLSKDEIIQIIESKKLA